MTDGLILNQTMFEANVTKTQSLQKKLATRAQIDKTAKDFEAVFLSQMLEHMFAGIDADPMSEAPGEDIYKSMMIDEYGKILAQSGGIGLADHVRRQMIEMQETQ